MAEVTSDEVGTWVARRYGYHAARQIVEGPAAFWAETGVLVRKKTGDYWYTTGEPTAAITAKSDRRFRRALGEIGADPRRAPGSIRTGVTAKQLGDWLLARGYDHIEDRVTDVGWAFVVSTRAGTTSLPHDDRALVVVRRTGEVWAPNMSPQQLWSWVSSDETTFLAWMAAEIPYLRPNEWVPL